MFLSSLWLRGKNSSIDDAWDLEFASDYCNEAHTVFHNLIYGVVEQLTTELDIVHPQTFIIKFNKNEM